ncbi:MAG: hypothetical protein K8J31_01970 [Anaerolineae bacterium]|jgi:predicted transcriptional regulator|nr:hypothetical protein [Anaerolineae bacterium]
MDLPSHLRALPPSAVEVVVYLSKHDMHMAGVDDICEEVGLSERGFGKAIRSLVTKGYVVMDGDQIYRLTDQGGAVAEEIAEYFGDDEAEEDPDAAVEQFTRRMVLVMPNRLVARQPTHVIVGFHPLREQTNLPVVVARLSMINGEPAIPQEAAFELTGEAAQQDFLITPDAYAQARVRVEVFQLGDNPDDIVVAGGLYVDVDVTAEGDPGERVAFGTDITFEHQD